MLSMELCYLLHSLQLFVILIVQRQHLSQQLASYYSQGHLRIFAHRYSNVQALSIQLSSLESSLYIYSTVLFP